MKKLNHRIFTKRKIILIFLFAIILPTVIVGLLSLGTFVQRRDAVQKLLESNRWIAGETAVNSLEKALLDYEKKTLQSADFVRFIQQNPDETTSLQNANNSSADYFLLDVELNILFPKTGNSVERMNQLGKQEPNKTFSKNLLKAESLEFSQKNFAEASAIYHECFSSALSIQERASMLEREGRCLLLAKRYDQAEAVYKELGRDYNQVFNNAGHPFGLLATFQLYEVAKIRKNNEQGVNILLDLYRKISDGAWLINSATFDFYRTEIEGILNGQLKDERFSKILESFTELQKQESPYRRQLTFSDFLQKKVIPKIREKLLQYRETDESGRLLLHSGSDFTLVSYTLLSNLTSGQTYYGGFCWDVSFLQKQLIPKILNDISKNSGLNISILDEKGANILTGQGESGSENSLKLNFRQFPFPWKLIASHTEIKTLEKTASRELLFFGVLLTVILLLMLLGAVLIIRDITREAETTRQKTEFVHTISHELKTPLTLIRLYGETLQRKGNLSESEKQDCYEIITKESERLTHLINNVLDFSRIEMGRKEFDFKMGELAVVIDETLEAYRYHLEKKGFIVYKEIARNLPEMSFDEDAIASVLINLLSNTMKFSLNEKEVTVRLFAEAGNAVLQVTDKGVGIPEAEFSNIFLQFYQADNKVISERRGSGLGLTLVKHITEAHHGSVKVESEIGKGSTFSIRLPLDGGSC